MTDTGGQPRQVILDLDEVRAPLSVGARRAKMFITLGSRPLEGELELDALMGPRTRLQIFGQALTEVQQASAKAEYAAWVTDSALRDLDLHFHLFLDRIWWAWQVAAHGPLVPEGFVPQGIESETNSATKAKRVLEALGEAEPDVAHFRSLSNARNVLAHHVGIVPPEKAFHDGQLQVSWLAMTQRFIDEDGVEHPWDEETGQIHSDRPTRFQVTYEVVARRFAPGERVRLTPHEVVQIALFYEIEGGKIFERLFQRLQDVGVAPAAKAGV